jgi:hypothetical protein
VRDAGSVAYGQNRSELSGANPFHLLKHLVHDVGRQGNVAEVAAFLLAFRQVESFLYRAKERGVTIAVAFDPQGRHDVKSGGKLFPDAARWVAPLVAPYAVEK